MPFRGYMLGFYICMCSVDNNLIVASYRFEMPFTKAEIKATLHVSAGNMARLALRI